MKSKTKELLSLIRLLRFASYFFITIGLLLLFTAGKKVVILLGNYFSSSSFSFLDGFLTIFLIVCSGIIIVVLFKFVSLLTELKDD